MLFTWPPFTEMRRCPGSAPRLLGKSRLEPGNKGANETTLVQIHGPSRVLILICVHLR